MSASPMARQVTESKTIPMKKVFINDPSELPSHYASTPGGTLYSTTPGGTKIVYEKAFLLNLRNSPISKTPPTFEIPDRVMKGKPNYSNITASVKKTCTARNNYSSKPKKATEEEDQFQMDI